MTRLRPPRVAKLVKNSAKLVKNGSSLPWVSQKPEKAINNAKKEYEKEGNNQKKKEGKVERACLSRTSPASQLLREDLREVNRGLISSRAPELTLSFVAKLQEVKQQRHLRHDRHLTSEDIKQALLPWSWSSGCLLSTHTPLFSPTSTLALTTELALIIIFALIYLLSSHFVLVFVLTVLTSMLLFTSERWCPALHVLIVAILIPSITFFFTALTDQQFRLRFLNSLGRKPPDDEIIKICLGRTASRTKKGQQQTNDELSSGQFLIDIDQLRPGLWFHLFSYADLILWAVRSRLICPLSCAISWCTTCSSFLAQKKRSVPGVSMTVSGPRSCRPNHKPSRAQISTSKQINKRK